MRRSTISLATVCATIGVLSSLSSAKVIPPGKARKAEKVMTKNNITLVQAIKAAEGKTNGTAVDAWVIVRPGREVQSQSGESEAGSKASAGSARTLEFAVTCLVNNQLKTAFVDSSGDVTSVEKGQPGGASRQSWSATNTGQSGEYYGTFAQGDGPQPTQRRAGAAGRGPEYGYGYGYDVRQPTNRYDRYYGDEYAWGPPPAPYKYRRAEPYYGNWNDRYEYSNSNGYLPGEPYGYYGENNGEFYNRREMRSRTGDRSQNQDGQGAGNGYQGEIGSNGPRRRSATYQTAAAPHLHRASELIDMTVTNNRNQDLGDLGDIAIDPKNGRIAYGVLTTGGYLGMGEKLFAIPWQSFSVGRGDNLELNVSEQQLRTAKGFNPDNWPDMANPRWAREVSAHYGHEMMSRQGESSSRQQASPQIVKGSDIIGKNVENDNGEQVGTVEDLALDPVRDRVELVIIGSKSPRGSGAQFVAVPWDRLNVTERGPVTLDLKGQSLSGAPQFNDAEWSRLRNPTWLADVYAYFDEQPYWVAMQAGQSQRSQRSGSE